jgi:hypothetical protein
MLSDSDRSDAGPAGRPDCVITVLPGGQPGLGPAEHKALRVLADAGLIPPLRSPAPAPAPITAPAPTTAPTPIAAAAAAPPPEPGHRSDTSPSFTTRTRLRRVNTRARVGESVETAFALH